MLAERAPQHEAAGADDAAQRSRHEDAVGDPDGARGDLGDDAADPRRGNRAVGHKGRARRDVCPFLHRPRLPDIALTALPLVFQFLLFSISCGQ